MALKAAVATLMKKKVLFILSFLPVYIGYQGADRRGNPSFTLKSLHPIINDRLQMITGRQTLTCISSLADFH